MIKIILSLIIAIILLGMSLYLFVISLAWGIKMSDESNFIPSYTLLLLSAVCWGVFYYLTHI